MNVISYFKNIDGELRFLLSSFGGSYYAVTRVVLANQDSISFVGEYEHTGYYTLPEIPTLGLEITITQEDLDDALVKINISKDLVFLVVECHPIQLGFLCDSPSVKVVYPHDVIYNMSIQHSKVFAYSECEIPVNFVNFILQNKALELAIQTGDWALAAYYWNAYFTTNSTNSQNCGCHAW